MPQRHDRLYGEEHESRLHEQYGGRAREHERGELRGRHERWDRRSGREGEDYPRFGSHRFQRDLDREESERGAYAGRGYDEPGWEREDDTYGSRSEGGSREHGRFGGWQQPSRERFSPGFDPRTRDFGAYRERGRFAGRGPKGYQRSDERIHEEVCDLLTADPDIDATEMTVSVKNCEVTLEGSVDSRWAKRRAEDVIEGVAGVHEVNNRLQVRPAEQSGRQGGEHGTGSRFGNGGTSTAG